ncbi:MAG TPA: sodium-independent anion transporter, partial [Gammaproteobacteria bacterium]|nr:sodium-independent anion transporter [Gammaproteobacteria bacterium]
ILLVAWGLIDFHHIGETLGKSRSETAILLVTFFATLFLELEFAIYLGVLLSLLLFLAKTSRPDIVTLAPDSMDPKRKLANVQAKPISECPQLKIIRIDRDIYFGSVNYIQSRLEHITGKEGIVHILIDASRMNYIDMAGAEMLVQENRRLQARGGGLYFCGIKSTVWQFLAEGRYVRIIGAERFFHHKAEAISLITQKLDNATCRACGLRIFHECAAVERA